MRYDIFENVMAYLATVADGLLPALPISLLIILLLLYVRGMVRAYRAAGDDWKRMDRDVRTVFLFAVPLFTREAAKQRWPGEAGDCGAFRLKQAT